MAVALSTRASCLAMLTIEPPSLIKPASVVGSCLTRLFKARGRALCIAKSAVDLNLLHQSLPL